MSDEKVRENRLRRAAARQGLELQKIRRRDPRAIDYGRYWLLDSETRAVWLDQGRFGLSIDDVEEWLSEGRSG
ncbi:MAG: hypothetical protein ACRDL7_01605 [Gaiellaceae bacterium]